MNATDDANLFPLAAGRQVRLAIGPFHLVAIGRPRRGRAVQWALPGGGRATLGDLLVLARRNAWPRPTLIAVSVRYVVDEISPETPNGE